MRYIKEFDAHKFESAWSQEDPWGIGKDSYPPDTIIDAVTHNDIKLVKKFIKDGTDLNIQDDFGFTALNIAANNNNVKIVKLLIDAGVHIDIPDEDGETALSCAVQNPVEKIHSRHVENNLEIVKLLIDSGADFDKKFIFSRSPNSTGLVTPLYRTTLNNKVEMCELLINAGADINTKNGVGNTVLMISITKEYDWDRSGRDLLGIAKLLIKAGADLNIQNNHGDTALICAIAYTASHYDELVLTSKFYKSIPQESIKKVKLLIDAGADWNIKNADDKDFLDFLDDYKEEIINLYPEQYKEYLMKKNANKYNL